MHALLFVFATAIQDETVTVLQKFVQIDTQNNPDRKLMGNELKLCGEVKSWIEKAGGAAEIFETAPGRGCLVARYKGDGSKGAFLLMAHVDVVDIEEGKWTHDPFKGEIDGGYLYGRGAIDDKGMAACCTVAFLNLLREKPKLTRDVILLLCADEESGGDWGIKPMIEKHFDTIKADFALNEGGHVITDAAGKVRYVAIQCAEKEMHNVKLVVTGQAGHASMPHADNCVVKLAQVLAKLSDFSAPVAVNEVTRGFFEGQSRLADDAERRDVFHRVAEGDLKAAQAVSTDPKFDTKLFNAMLHSTFTPTILAGGVRFNIIPSEAVCTMNIRLMPGDDLDRFLDSLRAAIGKRDDVRIDPEKPKEKREAPAPASGTGTELYKALEKVGKELWPDAVVMPSMSTGATDSRDLRLKGIPSYGLLPFPMTEEDRKRMHGNEERVPAAALPVGTDYLYRVIVEMGR